ncbi:MAG: DUF2017 domain-containing protein [Sporichthyaceae bacterium]|nr:DUF2017 domain-containing protein [Sporichthyaceae bacterium]
MSSPFRRARDGSIRVSFEPVETGVLTNLITQLGDLLQADQESSAPEWLGPEPAGSDPLTRGDPVADLAAAVGLPSEPVRSPTDPILARLLPDGYADDQEAAAEFRRYTEYDLRMAKLSAAAIVLDSLEGGESLKLDEAQALEWMRVLNDLRLAIGTRLDIDEDYEMAAEALAEDDPLRGLYAVYEWLTWMQDSLVSALAGDG